MARFQRQIRVKGVAPIRLYQDGEPLVNGLFFDLFEIWKSDHDGQRLQDSSVRKRAGSTGAWSEENVSLPTEVLNRRIMIEFAFTSDPLFDPVMNKAGGGPSPSLYLWCDLVVLGQARG